MSLGTGTRSRGCGHAWCVSAIRTSERRCEWHGRCAVGIRTMVRPGECKHTRVTTISVDRCLIVSGHQGDRHYGRRGGWRCDRRAGRQRPRKGYGGIVSEGRCACKSPPCASVSVVGVVVVAHGTIPTGGATGAVRRGLCGGTALGFELLACDVVFTDFDASSGPQFVCFAYGARNASVEEDAFR